MPAQAGSLPVVPAQAGSSLVIPAQAGIHGLRVGHDWIPACAGMTTRSRRRYDDARQTFLGRPITALMPSHP